MHCVSINELELLHIELFRMALSAETLKDRLEAIENVKHGVNAARLQVISETEGPDWIKDPANEELVAWVAGTAPARDAAIYEFSRLTRRYEETHERRLNVAEHVGKLIELSIAEGKFEGVQTRTGLLHQLTNDGRKYSIPGARDMDTVRSSWGVYRGIVHLGIAMDHFGELPSYPPEMLFQAELIRLKLSQNCARSTTTPYVSPEEQISFVFKSEIWGPRLKDRGVNIDVET